jgi:hypothetical protein
MPPIATGRDSGRRLQRTGYVRAIAGLRHQTPRPGRVEEGRRVVDLDAGVRCEVRFKLPVGLACSCESQEEDDDKGGTDGWEPWEPWEQTHDRLSGEEG